MNNNEEIEIRRDAIRRRARFYLYAGYLLLCIGVLSLSVSRHLGFILIAVGAVIRVLYYMKRYDLKIIDKLERKMKNFIAFLIPLILLICFVNSAFSFSPGDKADELDNLVWLQGAPFKIFDDQAKEKKIVIIEYWATWDKGSELSLPVLSAIQKKYKKENVVIVAISKEKEDVLKDFLEKKSQKISFNIARDPSGHISDRYTGNDARIPLVFIIDKDGKVVWRGHPLELEPVLKKILAGKFNLKKQVKISKLHKQLQGFLQIEDIVQTVRTADKILELDLSDDIAMRVRLFVFESRNNMPGALEFINKLIEKNQESSSLYFIKLDLMERINSPVDELHKSIREIFNKFKSNHEILQQLAWIAANRMRFGAIPLATALSVSKQSIELLMEEKEQDPAKLAVYLSTQAKILYLSGMLEQAIKIQKKVIILQKGDSAEPESTQLLHYYQSALKLRK